MNDSIASSLRIVENSTPEFRSLLRSSPETEFMKPESPKFPPRRSARLRGNV